MHQSSTICCSYIVPDLLPLVTTEDTDKVDKDNDAGGDFTELSCRLLADRSGDQPLCLFLGGPAFAWGA